MKRNLLEFCIWYEEVHILFTPDLHCLRALAFQRTRRWHTKSALAT